MHLKISATEFLAVGFYMVIFGFMWHSAASWAAQSDRPALVTLAGAMSFIL